jgi:thymidylate kinase
MTSSPPRTHRRRRTRSVALIGPDGAGKTSVTRRVGELLPVPSTVIYMGVNLEASSLMLPTTRLIVMVKRARGGRPDATVPAGAHAVARRSPRARVLHSAKAGARMANVFAEEWFRQAVAVYAQRRGRVVLFDRHFFCDFHAYDVEPRYGERPLSARFHGLMLARLYPKPDLVVYLDAPAAVLHRRKGEGTLEFLEARREDYLRLAGVLERFVVVDAEREPDIVAAEVVAHIMGGCPTPVDDGRGVDVDTVEHAAAGASGPRREGSLSAVARPRLLRRRHDGDAQGAGAGRAHLLGRGPGGGKTTASILDAAPESSARQRKGDRSVPWTDDKHTCDGARTDTDTDRRTP